MGDRWPLIGRDEELRYVNDVARRAGGVVLAGAAGVGKTRLAREALAAAAADGWGTWWATGTESARTLRLGAFAALLSSVGEDPLRALSEVRDALLDRAGDAGLLVVVDDGHLLDELSALLVHQLATTAGATVVMTVRSGEPTPEPVTALWKDAALERLEVQALSRTETGALLEAVLDGSVEDGSVARMWQLTRGNVLFLRELVDGEQAAGRLAAAGGLWRWHGPPALTAGLIELVEARMGRLAGGVREIVDLLALGDQLGAAVLERLADPAALEDAEAQGLITVEADGRRLQARLAHPLYGEVRRARVGLLRARRLRGRIATALGETGGRRADDDVRRAVLLLDSDLAADPVLLERAAHRCAQLQDMPTATRLARAAVAAGGGFEPQFIVVQALSMMGRGEEADAELRTLAALAETDLQRARAAFVQIGNLFWTMGRVREAEASLAQTLDTVSDDAARQTLSAIQAAFDGFLARPDSARRTAVQALTNPDLPPVAVVVATWGQAIALGAVGRIDELGPVMDRGYASTVFFDTAILRFPTTALHSQFLCLAGFLDAAEALTDRCASEAAQTVGGPRLMAMAMQAEIALARGMVRTAARRLRECIAGFTTLPGGWEYLSRLWLTKALAMAGDAEAARLALADLEAVLHPGFAFREPELVVARAWVAAAQGFTAQAVSLAREAARHAAVSNLHLHEVMALHTAVRLGDRRPAARLAVLAARVEGPMAQAAAAHARALAASDGDALHAVSKDWEAMGDLLSAADAAAQAAVVHLRRNRVQSARVCTARVEKLAGECQGARTPAVVEALLPLPITEKEREVAQLAARGLSDQAIANHLVISLRTVHGHLHHVYTKLGLTGRSDLSDLFPSA